MLPAMVLKPTKDAKARASVLLSRVGLERCAGHLPSQLSGGEQQKTAIARALINEPTVVYADEPTASLDSVAARDVLDIFAKLTHVVGRTVVMVTHVQDDERYAKLVVRLSDGRIADDNRVTHDGVRVEAPALSCICQRFIKQSNRGTLVLTTTLMAIAFINLVFIASLFNGIVRGSNDPIINTYVGHVTIGPPDQQQTLDHVGDTLANVLRTPGVVGASAQTAVPATMRYGNITLTRQILAVDPEREATVTNVATKLVEGTYLTPDDTTGILIGIQIAGGPDVEQNATSFKHAHAGETVILAMNGVDRPFTIRGVFHTKLITADSRAFITRHALAAMSPTTADKATMIIVRDSQTGSEPSLIAALRAHGVTGTFGTWEDNTGIMKSVTKSFRSINVLMSFVGLLIAAVTIFIVIYIDILNRKRQIGILRAIGIHAWIIRATYVLQSSVYALAGVIFGSAIFFAAIVPYFAAHPFSLPLCDASAGDQSAPISRCAQRPWCSWRSSLG